ncbi:hypothetical protein V1508DRAFT_435988 [Lipomyces doorenjongii]|uniref:uncharacterized protein n=1 Tax=Lipomyces doorenjongii TaxID=383834 RepID=UPI0034CF1D7E
MVKFLARCPSFNTSGSYNKSSRDGDIRDEPQAALRGTVASLPLKGKSALITGAGRVLGVYITQELAEVGASCIAIIGRDKARIDVAQKNFSDAYPSTEYTTFAADITDEQTIVDVFKIFGAPDVLVNNAGVFPDAGPFVEQSLAEWFSGFIINILGTATVAQKFLQAKWKFNPAIVLNVSSMAAHMRFPLIRWSGYNGSKMGQVRIFENIRFEHPEVRFVNVHPGNIESDGFTPSGASEPSGGMTDGKLVGQLFAWLASGEADFLSGRFVWAEWDIEELKAKEKSILENDLLLTTVDRFSKGFLWYTLYQMTTCAVDC